MAALEDLPADVPVAQACRDIGVSRATLYRHTSPPNPPKPRFSQPARTLSADEVATLHRVLHEERFVDQPPAEIFAQLLSEGTYVASIRTMYRYLGRWGEVHERRNQRSGGPHAMPSLTASAPNQIWTWDITKLAGPQPGVFYYAYVMIDLYSRHVVGWMVAERENGDLASAFLKQTMLLRGIEPKGLTIHSDRGSPMTCKTTTQMLATLGVTKSHSRPHVSDDNAFSEAQFKTLKYQPDFPGRFGSLLHAKAYLEAFFTWYNEHHYHHGLALFTPGQVYRGEVTELAKHRQLVLDAVYQEHPERFVGGPPKVRLPAAEVSINPRTGPQPEEAAIPSAEPPPEASLRPSPASAESARAAAKGKREPGAAQSHAEPLASMASTARTRPCPKRAREQAAPIDGPMASSMA